MWDYEQMEPGKAFAICYWDESYGDPDDVHPDDRHAFALFQELNRRIFEVDGSDDDYVTLRYKEDVFRVRHSQVERVRPPRFKIGDVVRARNEGVLDSGLITDIFLHSPTALYALSFSGIRGSRTYEESELVKISSTNTQAHRP